MSNEEILKHLDACVWEKERVTLIKSKCQDAPGEFYGNLDYVRTLRSGLNDNIQQLDQLLNDYQNEFNDNVRGEIDG